MTKLSPSGSLEDKRLDLVSLMLKPFDCLSSDWSKSHVWETLVRALSEYIFTYKHGPGLLTTSQYPYQRRCTEATTSHPPRHWWSINNNNNNNSKTSWNMYISSLPSKLGHTCIGWSRSEPWSWSEQRTMCFLGHLKTIVTSLHHPAVFYMGNCYKAPDCRLPLKICQDDGALLNEMVKYWKQFIT